MLADSHCHLDQLPDPALALAEAAAAGVAAVAAVSQDRASMAAVLQLKARYPGTVLAGLGVHPSEVTRRPAQETEADLAFLAAYLPAADLVGETGLDFAWAAEAADRERQEQVLQRHLELAAAHRRPANLHSRRSQRQVMERAIAFTRATGLGAQLHWFTHSPRLVRQCNDAGLFVSVGPAVLDDGPALQVALAVADDLLLLETDAPVAIGGVPGHPRRVLEVARKLAACKGVSLAEIAARTAANLRRFLGPPPSPPAGGREPGGAGRCS